MKTTLLTSLAVLSLVVAPLITPKAAAHCDTLDGPVVDTAKLALSKGDVTPTLKWVNKEGEDEVRKAFALAMKVRSLGEDARKLADTHFFETLVRVHRAGEGVPFTGLKPAGAIDPGFVAADNALHDGAVEQLSAGIEKSVQDGLRMRFVEVIQKKQHADESIEAGRAYVAAYIAYAHYVEALHTLTSTSVDAEKHHLHAAAEDSE